MKYKQLVEAIKEIKKSEFPKISEIKEWISQIRETNNLRPKFLIESNFSPKIIKLGDDDLSSPRLSGIYCPKQNTIIVLQFSAQHYHWPNDVTTGRYDSVLPADILKEMKELYPDDSKDGKVSVNYEYYFCRRNMLTFYITSSKESGYKSDLFIRCNKKTLWDATKLCEYVVDLRQNISTVGIDEMECNMSEGFAERTNYYTFVPTVGSPVDERELRQYRFH